MMLVHFSLPVYIATPDEFQHSWILFLHIGFKFLLNSFTNDKSFTLFLQQAEGRRNAFSYYGNGFLTRDVTSVGHQPCRYVIVM
jgi:hypothetical protein